MKQLDISTWAFIGSRYKRGWTTRAIGRCLHMSGRTVERWVQYYKIRRRGRQIKRQGELFS